jgi:hypothetical protein
MNKRPKPCFLREQGDLMGVLTINTVSNLVMANTVIGDLSMFLNLCNPSIQCMDLSV